MGKLFLVAFLGLLMVAYGTLENFILDDTATLGELENLDIEEGDDIELFDISSWTSKRGRKDIVNVDDFGAVGDGVADDTQAFRTAWNTACSTEHAVFMVPENRIYLVSATRFKGPCADKLVIQIDGTIIAPGDPSSWDAKDMRIWLSFSLLKGVNIQGQGVIEGRGDGWWSSSCKRNKSRPCKGAPTALTIASSTAVKVKGLTFNNSQQIHFAISQCDSVRVSTVQIYAPGNSPNTDGIHITASQNVVVQDAIIGTGDDCISIVNASSNIKMKRIKCGPGHGISIGSLGKDNSTGIVTNVVLDTAVCRETQNCLRIKTWQGGTGNVKAVRFSKVKMEGVKNPIIIDQFYCDSSEPCPILPSAVQVTEIMYDKISGTTNSTVAMLFNCSETVPCTNILVRNINLESTNGQPVVTFCHSARGYSDGYVQPSAECLEQTQSKQGGPSSH